MVSKLIKILSVLILFTNFLIADEPTVSAEIDLYKALESRPLAGTITISHDEKSKIDNTSFQMDGKPLHASFVKSVKISPREPLELSIFTFEIPGKPKGLYVLPPVSVKIDGKSYASTPSSFEVTGTQSVRVAEQRVPQKARLILKANVNGPPIIYPHQRMTFIYDIGYSGNIDLVAQSLPLLDAKGFQKIGDKKVIEGEEEGLSIQQIAQEVQTLEPGQYQFPLSYIEGYAYTQDSSKQKKYYDPKLRAEASPINVIVSAFPTQGKPSSFSGAVGQFTMQTNLLTPSKSLMGEKMVLSISIGGDGDLTTVSIPDLSPLRAQFRLGDLPPVGEIKGNFKTFKVELFPLSMTVNQIPSLEFSYLDIIANRYETVRSAPISISIVGKEKEPETKAETKIIEEKPSTSVPESVEKNVQVEPNSTQRMEDSKENLSLQQPKGIEIHGAYKLEYKDLSDRFFGIWFGLWLIPILFVLALLHMPFKKYLEQRKENIPQHVSDDLWKQWQQTPMNSKNYFSLLQNALLMRLYEMNLIRNSKMPLTDMPEDGFPGKVKRFLMRLQEERFTGTLQEGNATVYSEAKALWNEMGG